MKVKYIIDHNCLEKSIEIFNYTFLFYTMADDIVCVGGGGVGGGGAGLGKERRGFLILCM